MSALLEQQTVEMTQIFCSEFISSQLSGPNFDKAFANGFLAPQKPANLAPVTTSISISTIVLSGGESQDVAQPKKKNSYSIERRFLLSSLVIPISHKRTSFKTQFRQQATCLEYFRRTKNTNKFNLHLFTDGFKKS